MKPHKHLRDNIVARARDKGNTLTYWFFIKVKRKWIDFDIRDVSHAIGVPYPECLDRHNYKFGSTPSQYADVLSKELEEVSNWVTGNHIAILLILHVTCGDAIDRSVNKP